MTNWILVIGFIIVIALQLVQIDLTWKSWSWVKLTFVPWFVSIGNAVNPDKK